MKSPGPCYTRGVYNGRVLATLVLLSVTLSLSSSSGGAEASSISISVETGRRRIRDEEGADGLRADSAGALTRDWSEARYSSS